MKAKATVRLEFASKRQLEIVLDALKPEVKKPTSLRSKESLKKEESFLVLRVEAEDTVALRAALNAYLRWINSVASVLGVLERK